jgi:hypothetical protein
MPVHEKISREGPAHVTKADDTDPEWDIGRNYLPILQRFTRGLDDWTELQSLDAWLGHG